MLISDGLMKEIRESRPDVPQGSPIVLDMEGVTGVEFTGIEELVNRLVEVADGAPIQFVNTRKSLESALDQCDPTQVITRIRSSC
eukprot:COSAG01_NODE_6639_length_3567_cov_37.767013_4_plen_85_part_00